MKRIIFCFLMSSFAFSLFAQEEDFDRLIRRGIELHDRGYYNAAIKCYEEGTEIYPESILPYYFMAQSYAHLNRPKDFRECVDKAFLMDMGRDPVEKVTVYLEALEMYVTLILAEKKSSEKASKEKREAIDDDKETPKDDEEVASDENEEAD